MRVLWVHDGYQALVERFIEYVVEDHLTICERGLEDI